MKMAGEQVGPLHLCVEKLVSAKASKLPGSLAAVPFFSNFFSPCDGFSCCFSVFHIEGKEKHQRGLRAQPGPPTGLAHKVVRTQKVLTHSFAKKVNSCPILDRQELGKLL